MIPGRKRVIRPLDLLALEFEFGNLDLKTVDGVDGKEACLEPMGTDGYIILHFPPQNIAEEAFVEPSPEDPKQQSQSRISGPSRLVFSVPQGITIPYTLADILHWCTRLPMRIVPQGMAVDSTTYDRRVSVIRSLVKEIPLLQEAARRGLISIPGEEGGVGGIEQRPTETYSPSFDAEWKEWCETSPLAASLLGSQDDAVRNLPSRSSPPLRPPSADETAIELPYRLILSPHANAGWTHATLPMTHEEQASGNPVSCQGTGGGRTELWHTRLGFRCGKQPGATSVDEFSPYRSLRAVWTRDWPKSPTDWLVNDTSPFLMSLNTKDRQNLVHLMSNYSVYQFPPPAQVEKLMLSSLGAWVELHGEWEPISSEKIPLTVEAWRQQGTMGRDHHVQIVEKGYLFPLGHRASFVKVTERKFPPDNPGKPEGNPAYLRQRHFIVVKPEKTYVNQTGFAQYDRQLPFDRIRIMTSVTPDLDDPRSLIQGETLPSTESPVFWPTVNNGEKFRFQVVGEDRFSHHIEFSIPLIFIRADYASKFNQVKIAQDEYQRGEVEGEIAGQPLSLLRESDKNTTFDLHGIQFIAHIPTDDEFGILKKNLGDDIPQFYPAVDHFSLVIPAVREMTDNTATSQVRYDDVFLKEGLKGGKLFATLKDPLDLSFAGKGDRCGVLITPNFQITGLSQIMGPVGGKLTNIREDNFNPLDFFQMPDAKKGLDAKIFGVISLGEIIETVEDFTESSPEIPKFISDGVNRKIEFHWNPKLRDWKGIFLTNDGQATLSVDVTLTVKEIVNDNEPPTFDKTIDVRATMENFRVKLLGDSTPFLEVTFNKLQYISEKGKKPDVSVVLGEIQFLGPLSFVKELEKYIPLSGLSDPPVLDVTAEGVRAGYTVGIPNVSVGVFSLANISLGGVATIPFTEKPLSFRFNFCERQCPFNLTVMAFGGTGFFNLTVDPHGVQVMEAALEFGANLSINFGVASGGVHVMAGIYFKKDGDIVILIGYLRMGGQVDVLGLISAAIELYMQLMYEAASGKCAGSATITVEVSIFFWSTSVEIHAERKFAGSGSDPTFRDVMGPYTDRVGRDVYPWLEYCGAFAPVGVGGVD